MRQILSAVLLCAVLWLASGCGNDDVKTAKPADAAAAAADIAATADAVVATDTAKPACTVAADCGQPNSCRAWACNNGQCADQPAADGSACVLPDLCTTGATCSGGQCGGGKAKDCDDKEACTADTCEAATGKCVHAPVAATPCDDGDPCTSDACQGGKCVAGPSTCECASNGDCAAKEDGNLCNGTLYCAKDTVPFVCKVNPATVVVCPDSGDTCQPATCEPKTGKCATKSLEDGAICDDGVKCTVGDVCAGGKCKGGENVCCTSNADCAKFDGGDKCLGAWFCNKATKQCQINPVTIVVCKTVDDTYCQKNACDKKTGVCGLQPVADSTACDDGNPCTSGDVCQKGQCAASANTCTCTNDADCAGKDDGDLCNGVPFCNKATGKCEPNPATVVVCPTVSDTDCAKNTCDPASGKCAPKPVKDGTNCEADGSKCTPDDTCKAGACVAGTNTCKCGNDGDCAQFEDGDLCNGTLFCDQQKNTCSVNPATVVGCSAAANTECAQNLCNPKLGKCALTFVNQGKPCDDGVVCTTGDTCDNGTCKGGADVCKCKADGDCASQEDGDLCNGTLFCNKGKLPWACEVNPATTIACPSANDNFCQKNTCAPQSGLCAMKFLHNDEVCDDKSACTSGEICKLGVCANPALDLSKPCDDNNPCTDDSCNPATGCAHLPNSATCTDGDACTANDACSNGKCQSSKPLDCNDNNACTTELCNKLAGCVQFNNADLCDDGNACTVGDGCKAGKCQSGAPKDCSDGKPCTLDACDPKTGACSNPNADPAVVCNDGIACTSEACDPAKGCIYTPAAALCDDSIACTADACAGAAGCTHVPDDSKCNDNNACTVDTCAATGCSNASAFDGAGCSDGDPCTLSDSCAAGKCVPGSKAPNCGAAAQFCKTQADGVSCDDGDVCTAASSCQNKVCAAAVTATILTTIAGSKGATQSMDGKGKAGTVNTPNAVAVDAAGNVYFSEDNAHTIRKLTADGTVSTFAGQPGVPGNSDGKGSEAHFNHPWGLAFDSAGVLYVADSGNHRIRQVAPDGTVTTWAGSTSGPADGVGTKAQFYTPTGIAFDSAGVLYVADSNTHRIRKVAKDATVTTFAGGNYGFKDGVGAAAQFYTPYAVAVAPNGDVWVADRSNFAVRKISPAGAVTTVAGSPAKGFVDATGNAAKFDNPQGIAVDAQGNAYVGDYLTDRIRKVTPAGVVTSVNATASACYHDKCSPGGPLAGTCDPCVDLVCKVDSTCCTSNWTASCMAKVATACGAAAACQPYVLTGQTAANTAPLDGPTGVAFDALGRLLIADYDGGRIVRLDFRTHGCDDKNPCTLDTCDPGTGKCSNDAKAICDDSNPCTVDTCDAASGQCSYANAADGTACSAGDNCTVGLQCTAGLCQASGQVATWSGKDPGELDGALADARYYRPGRIARDGAGNLFVTEYGNHLVRKIAASGVVTTYAGAAWNNNGYVDGPALWARFNTPYGIAIDGKGNLFVADKSNHAIRKVSVDGIVSTYAGGNGNGFVNGSGKAVKFYNPNDVLIGAGGVLYVSDEANQAIRKIAPDGTVTTLTGGSTYGWLDGAPNVARFNNPDGLAMDAAGNLYVADADNHAIRRVRPDGSVTTVAGLGVAGASDGVLPFGVRLTKPYGLASDAMGNLLVAEGGNRLRLLLAGGRSHTLAGSGAAGFADGFGAAAVFDTPTAILVLPSGEFLVADAHNNRLRKVKAVVKSCDDGNACTADFCAPQLGCKHAAVADGSSCSDGELCTQSDVCAAGTCKAGAKAANCPCKPGPTGGCDDGNPCTVDGCDPVKGCAATNLADGSACDDGNACTTGDVCMAGSCVPNPSDWVVEQWAGTEDKGISVGSGYRDGYRRQTGGTNASALLGIPAGIALDGAGSLWIADYGTHTVRRLDPNGYLTTVAGFPYNGQGFADGKGSAARFNNPEDVAVDAAGNAYVADSANHAIRKIAPDGTVTTLAGLPTKAGFADGKGAAALFNTPRGLTVDLVGNVYVADSVNNRIRKVAPDGQVTTIAGSTAGHVDGVGVAALFSNPRDLTFLPDGDLAVIDTDNYCVRRVSLGGTVNTIAGLGQGFADGPAPIGAKFNSSFGIAADSSGAIYVADSFGSRLRRIGTDGMVTTIAGSGTGGAATSGPAKGASLYRPRSIAIDSQGRLLLSDYLNYRIVRLRPVGASCDDGNDCTADSCDPKAGCSHAKAGASACQGNPPCTVATCDETLGRCVYAPAADGSLCDGPGGCAKQCRGGTCTGQAVVSTLAGGAMGTVDGVGATAKLNAPGRFATAADGTLYVAEFGGHVIRKIAPDGTVTTLAGTAGSAGYAEGKGTSAKFNGPAGLAIGTDGALYVADLYNQRIRRVAMDGAVSTIAGSGVGGAKDDASLLAQFNHPNDVVADGAGNLYVADTENHRLRKISADGQVTTIAGSSAGWTDGPTATAAKFNNPAGVAIDSAGVLWVTDYTNNVIRRVEIDGATTTVAGRDNSYFNGQGRVSSAFSGPSDLVVAADGSLFVTDRGNNVVRRVWPDGSSQVAAGDKGSGWVDGFGGEARFNMPIGIALDAVGNLLVGDYGNHRVRKLSFSNATCAALAGSSKYAAGSSCKAIAATAAWSGSATFWVDPNGGSKDDAIKTTCDQSTDGGGWTRVDESVSAANVDLLRGGNGQMLLKCSDDSPNAVISPPSTAGWSWTKKAKVAGDWLANGKKVACGGDASFDDVGCGFGYGCTSGPKDPAQVLPGVMNGNQCAGSKTVQTGAAFSLCGSASYGGYSVFVRAAQ